MTTFQQDTLAFLGYNDYLIYLDRHHEYAKQAFNTEEMLDYYLDYHEMDKVFPMGKVRRTLYKQGTECNPIVIE